VTDERLDPRTWLIWGAAASLPALLGRNPFPLAVVLIAALSVRAAWSGDSPSIASWSSLIRLTIFFAVIGALFNVLTVRSGNHVIATIPSRIPLLHGDVTLNALVFGLLSALAAVTLVLVGATVAASLDWAALVRMLPPGLTTIAVAGSVAFAFLPQTARAFVDIKEAQAARGHRLRSARDLVPLLAPLLTGGLERALTLAESLESRGFGAPTAPGRKPSLTSGAATAVGLAAGTASAYLFAVNRLAEAGLAAAVALACLAIVVARTRPAMVGRTRYRDPRWRRIDSLVTAASIVAAIATLAASNLASGALRYEPYPDLIAPAVNLPALAALLLLLAPALAAPQTAGEAAS
jgi:energy-coupling factor transport system permease protein